MIGPPQPQEIRSAREAVEHTQAVAGRTVHAGERAWQMWEAGDRRMPAASWELYLIKTGQENEAHRRNINRD